MVTVLQCGETLNRNLFSNMIVMEPYSFFKRFWNLSGNVPLVMNRYKTKMKCWKLMGRYVASEDCGQLLIYENRKSAP